MRADDRTIRNFGTQWKRYPDFSGYICSQDLLADNIEPLLNLAELQGTRVAEIGSGQGRFATMLLDAGVAHLLAIEPSSASEVLQRNLRRFGSRAECLEAQGEAIPPNGEFDYVFAIGVLHHIEHPMPTVEAAFRALRPG